MLSSLLSDFWHPLLSDHIQAFIRFSYGILLITFLVNAAPHWRRFFGSERWNGYADDSPLNNLLLNPVCSQLLLWGWLAIAVFITAGMWSVWFSFVNVVLCRHFFVGMRWRSIARGMGAPGFMTYWLAVAVWLLEYSSHYAGANFRDLVVVTLQVDFALIILTAGIYKLTSGYLYNAGMEYGMVNPEWGYLWRCFIIFSPNHPVIWINNQLAWSLEVLAAIFMLIPAARCYGGLLIIASFVYIAVQIRLGVLPYMVMLCGVFYFTAGTAGDLWLAPWGAALPRSTAPAWIGAPLMTDILAIAIGCYLLLLPLARIGQFINLYGRIRLPGVLQPALDRYTHFLGIFIWRVFTQDLTNFYICIHSQSKSTGKRKLLTNWGWQGGLRYSHVCESIAVTSVFTTLKYYPNDRDLFEQKLLRYAHTIPCRADEELVFEYICIEKQSSSFQHTPVREYIVDPHLNTIKEIVLAPNTTVSEARAHVPVLDVARPGIFVAQRG